jgi:hypothetical protein
MAPRERHRHVEVGAAGLERGVEDRRVQPRVAGVEDHVRALGAGELGDRGAVARVDRGGGEAAVVEPGDRGLRPRGVEVGEDHAVEEVAAAGDGGEGRPDAAGAEDEDAHGRQPIRAPRRRSG